MEWTGRLLAKPVGAKLKLTIPEGRHYRTQEYYPNLTVTSPKLVTTPTDYTHCLSIVLVRLKRNRHYPVHEETNKTLKTEKNKWTEK